MALAEEGHTISEIGRRVGVERHTVKKYVDEAAKAAGAERAAENSAQALADFEKAPASLLTQAQVGKLVALLDTVELHLCSCGHQIPLLGHVQAELKVKCLRCGTWWEFGVLRKKGPRPRLSRGTSV